MASVPVAKFGGFAADIEGCAGLLGSHQSERALLEHGVTGAGLHEASGIVELSEERGAAVESIEGHSLSIGHPFDMEGKLFVRAVAPVGVVLEIPLLNAGGDGIVTSPEPTSMLSGAGVLSGFLERSKRVGEDHIGRERACEAVALLIDVFCDGTDGGPVLGSGAEASADGDMPGVSGLKVVAAAAVVILVVRHGPDDSELVGDHRGAGEVLGDEEVGSAAGDRLERPANLVGSLGLHVEGFELAGSAEEEQEDDGLGLRTDFGELSFSGLGFGGLGFGGEESRERESEESRSPRLEDLAARNSIAGGSRRSLNREHEDVLSGNEIVTTGT